MCKVEWKRQYITAWKFTWNPCHPYHPPLWFCFLSACQTNLLKSWKLRKDLGGWESVGFGNDAKGPWCYLMVANHHLQYTLHLHCCTPLSVWQFRVNSFFRAPNDMWQLFGPKVLIVVGGSVLLHVLKQSSILQFSLKTSKLGQIIGGILVS